MQAYMVLVSLLLFEIAIGEKLLRPTRKCVPTATIHGPCHVCVCHTDGMYHCRKKVCEEAEAANSSSSVCEPNQLYRQDSTFCSCTNSGQWRSINCRELFHRLLLKNDPIKKHIRTNIACKPNRLYIIDCNVCLCKASGVINFDSCTTRPCPKCHKINICKPGDVYRSANELCICSVINYYIDRLCIKVVEDVTQLIPDKSLTKIMELERSYPRIVESKCDNNVTIYKDCNTCTCYKNKYHCTSRLCYDNKEVLRRGKIKKSSLPMLKSDQQKCTPGKKYRFKCNTCLCNRKGRPISNVTRTRLRNKALPEINEGDPCTPGLSYKMDCNRCHCTNAKKLICTKMACLDWSNLINQHSGKLRQGMMTIPKPGAKKMMTSTIKSPSMPDSPKKIETQTSSGMFPVPYLPKGRCVPGRTYKNGCRLCFCNYKSKASCSKNDKIACTMENGRPRPVREPEDIRRPFIREELKKIKELSSQSQKCEPGKTYRVSCNTCICTERNNLLCTRALCLSFEDINRVEANEKSGKKCSSNKLTVQDCMECKCIKGKTACKQIENCVSETRERLSKGKNVDLKMKIDPLKDKCVPNGIYTEHCNRCYCQPDGSLRCTQKTCLNYSQSKALDDQFKKLNEKAL